MNKEKEILLSSFSRLGECVLCKGQIEKDKSERNGLCSKCESSRRFKYKIGDPVEYKGEMWEVKGRVVVELEGDDIFLNQYFIQHEENYKHVFEGGLGEEGRKIKESVCPKCGDIIRYKPEDANIVTCINCGSWCWTDDLIDITKTER